MVKLLGSSLMVMLVFFGSLGLTEMTSKVVGWLEAGGVRLEAACS